MILCIFFFVMPEDSGILLVNCLGDSIRYILKDSFRKPSIKFFEYFTWIHNKKSPEDLQKTMPGIPAKIPRDFFQE